MSISYFLAISGAELDNIQHSLLSCQCITCKAFYKQVRAEICVVRVSYAGNQYFLIIEKSNIMILMSLIYLSNLVTRLCGSQKSLKVKQKEPPFASRL